MTDHLSTWQVKQLGVSALAEDEAVAATVHMAACQSCHQRFVEELRHQRGSAPFSFTLEPEFWFRDDHVDFDLLVGLADKTLDEETLEIIDIHLSTCEPCREDVRSFLAFREASVCEMYISYARPAYQIIHNAGAAPWWQRLQSRAVYAVAAIVLVAVALLIGVITVNRRSGSLDASKQANTSPHVEGGPGTSPSATPNAVSSSPGADDVAKVTILKDAGGEVTIDKNGRVTGIDEVSENTRQLIARAALAEQIGPPEVLRRLSGEQGGLRGNEKGPQEFKLLYPVRSVVIGDRPVFRWQSLPGVSSYRVYVVDPDGKQLRKSEELPPSVTQWQLPAPLRRGEIYSWVVTATVDGKQVVSPSSSAPELKFAVLSTADFQELERLKKSSSHLALGVFYATAGLLKEAEREFESLIKLNPDSELPRKLLQSVRSIEKEN